MIRAKLAQLAAMAEVTKLKAERNQHWDYELSEECAKIANLAKDIAAMVKK